jgi:hypothetical protein
MPDRDVQTRGRPGNAELFPGRVDPRVGSGRVGPGQEYFNIRWVGSGPDTGGLGRLHVPGLYLNPPFLWLAYAHTLTLNDTHVAVIAL